MKKYISLIVAVVLAANVFAQAPEKMSYQAVIRNATDALVQNSPIGMQISILQGNPNGNAVYVETQTPNTNANGLVSLEIGGGTVVSGNFSAIDWAAGPYYIQTEIDPAGGNSYSITGISQMMSVPYAQYAEVAAVADVAINDQVDDADSDPANEIQDISLSGANLSITDGSTIDLSSITNTTKSILITPGMMPPTTFLGGTALGNIGGWGHPCIDYPTGVSSMTRISLPSPPDWDGTPFTFKVIYTSTGTTGDFNFLSQARGLAAGDDVNQGPGGAGLILSSPSAVNEVKVAILTSGFGALKTNQEVMNIWFRRVGTASNDTSPDTLRVLGFVITYNTI
ncbi:MAG: hypothetical protein AAF206_04510 [Bacteroidota bacterium]